MSFTTAQRNAVLEMLRRETWKEGTSFNNLWQNTKPPFFAPQDLVHLLHTLTQEGRIVRVNDLYVLVEKIPTTPALTERQQRLMKWQPPAKSVAAFGVSDDETPAPAVATPLPLGTLRRCRPGGSIALFFYRHREQHPITVPLLQHLLPEVPYPTLYSTLTRLVNAEYLTVDKSSLPHLFKWSGKYRYPFDGVQAGDEKLLDVFDARLPPVKTAPPSAEPAQVSTEPVAQVEIEQPQPASPPDPIASRPESTPGEKVYQALLKAQIAETEAAISGLQTKLALLKDALNNP